MTATTLHKGSQSPKPGFTLIELLIVISILAILSGLALVVLRDAQETSRHARCIAQVSQIQTILATKLEDLEIRQLPFRTSLITNKNTGKPTTWPERQEIRKRAILDWIRSELPFEASCWNIRSPYPSGLQNYTWNGNEYLQLYRTSSGDLKVNTELQAPQFNPGTTTDKAGAKFLYAILKTTWHQDNRAIDICKPSEILVDPLDDRKYIADAFGDPLQIVVFVDWNQNGVFDQNLIPGPNSFPEEFHINLDGFKVDGNFVPLPELHQIVFQIKYKRQNEK
jgi:prepilin-type N-terminal cleavage/methylation domain-containing protein